MLINAKLHRIQSSKFKVFLLSFSGKHCMHLKNYAPGQL